MVPELARPIGILGGVGPEAGLDLFHKILAATRATRDQDHLPVHLLSHPHRIADRTAFLLGTSDANPGHALADLADRLIESGCTVLGMPCHTAHAPSIFAPIRERVGDRAEFVHLAEAVRDELRRTFPEARTVGVLATTGTVATGLYTDHLEPAGFRVLYPEDEIQTRCVQTAIFDTEWGIKSTLGGPDPRAVAVLHEAAAHLATRGADTILLACTELPLALTEQTVHGVPLVDATRVLARALVRQSAPDLLKT